MPVKIRYISYELPLTSAWPGVRDRQLTQRKGWLVSVADDRFQGHGDCAPFPSAGTESHSQALLLLQQVGEKSWIDPAALRSALEQHSTGYPAACHALESAVLDLQSKRSGIPLRRLLNPGASTRISVNALSGSVCRENAVAHQEQGFGVIKLKAGGQEMRDDIRCLRKVCDALSPGVRIRLDANGAWSMDQALFFLDALAGLPIESVEEPLRSPELSDYTRLQSHTAITLALDESLQRMNLDEILSCKDIRRLVLKPGALGGPSRSFALARQATAAGMDCVVTSLVDSAVGIWTGCQLAAAVDALCPGLAHGLATSSWLGKDIAKPPDIRAGYISLPNKPGSGVDEIFQNNLSRPFS